MNYHDGTWDVEGEQEDAPHSPGNNAPEFVPITEAHRYPSVQEEGWTAQVVDQLGLDLLLWGNAYTVGGKRVDPATVAVLRRTPQGTTEPAHPKIHSQEEFLTALDILLDHTLHADECYCDPNDTVCVCVIGKVRAAMPPCGAVRPRPFEDQRLTQPRKYWTCTRNAHPASPDRHVFG